MSEQPDLFQLPKPRPNRYRLFLAIFPDVEATDPICEYQTNLREKFGLTGKPRPRSQLLS